ncbi:MAG: HWE histidine kinase domain-containing protein [Pseudomonadota bacterium]
MDMPRPGKGAPKSVKDRLQLYDDPDASFRALLALDAGNMGSWRYDIETGFVTGDALSAELFGLGQLPQPWPVDTVFAAIHPEDVMMVQEAVQTSIENNDFYDTKFRVVLGDDLADTASHRWLGGRGSVTERAHDGRALVMVGVNWDETHQKRIDERMTMMATELDHRIRNVFGVMCAIINIGDRTAADKDSFSRTLMAQVRAMADAHALTTNLHQDNTGEDKAITVSDLLHSALAPWLPDHHGTPAGDDRGIAVRITAGPEITLPRHNASSLAMVIYELTANAAKYGALSKAGGCLDVHVQLGSGQMLSLQWSETCASPAKLPVDEDDQAGGFGFTLIDLCLTGLQGKIVRKMRPDGMQVMLTMPVST